MAMTLSVIIITKNEATHIAQCLESIKWADEIIVLDSGSVDETISICRQFTPHVFETDWQGFGVQKQRALNKATGDWVLSIDADEIITPELRAEIEQAIRQNQHDAFLLPRLSSYCGKFIKHSGWYPDYILRLFRRELGHFTNDVIHERVVVNGKTGKLTSPILHESYSDLSEVLEKVNSYSSLNAQKLFEHDVNSSLSKAIFRALWKFTQTYFIKAAFLDGKHGLMLAISSAESVYYKYLKLLELQNKCR
ncbi:MAG: glycosyltransferase family 2 protein [Methylococcales bacterium]|nr:glycosyltransferase family 2 protein [Methylococcales bacterium]MDD5755308.1 glycosyltransferase family 2 protein [Methylococcales bacterium]